MIQAAWSATWGRTWARKAKATDSGTWQRVALKEAPEVNRLWGL